jgi:hypothetical protein
LINLKILASEFPFHGWKNPEIAWGEIWIEFCVHLYAISGLFQPCKGSSEERISKWSTICSTFSKSGWSVVRSACLPREVLRKRDRHRTSLEFRLGVTRWIPELRKWPSYHGLLGYGTV